MSSQYPPAWGAQPPSQPLSLADTSGSSLTPGERARMERNRQKALQIRAAKQAAQNGQGLHGTSGTSTTTAGHPYTAPPGQSFQHPTWQQPARPRPVLPRCTPPDPGYSRLAPVYPIPRAPQATVRPAIPMPTPCTALPPTVHRPASLPAAIGALRADSQQYAQHHPQTRASPDYQPVPLQTPAWAPRARAAHPLALFQTPLLSNQVQRAPPQSMNQTSARWPRSEQPRDVPPTQPSPPARAASPPLKRQNFGKRMVAGPMKKLDASDYGPATTITFGPAPAQPPKKLTQATLGDVMKKYRAGREVGEQEAPPPHPFGHAPVVSSNPVNWGEKEEGNNGGGSNVSDGGGADPLGKAATAAAHSPFRWDSSAAKPPCTAPKMTKVSHIIEPSVSNVTATSTHSMHSSMASHWSIPRPRQHQSTSLLSGPLPPSQPPSTSAFKLQARATLLGADCAPDAAAESASAQRWSWLQNRVDAAGRSPDDAAFDPRTLHIPQQEFAKLRGFNRQYWSIKKDAMDLVLFVRVGSFYELYDTDADVGLRVGLNPMGTGPEANMWKVGCNAGSFQHWAAKVLALGYCVGRVEECSGRRDPDPACAKLVARRLAQIYTPGTVTTPLAGEWEGEGGPQPYVALFEGANSLMGACVVDVPSATLGLAQWHEVDATRSTLGMLLSQINPAEVVVLGRRELSLDTRKALKRHRPLVTDGVERPLVVSYLRRYTLTHDPECPDHLPGLMRATEAAYFALNGNDAAFRDAAASLCDMPLAAAALQMALAHLKATDTARYVLPNVTLTAMASFTLDGVRNTGHMMLDAAALHSLELVEGSLGGVKGSLLAFLSSAAATAAGRRRIRTWLCSPLYRVGDINERLDTVSAFMKAPEAAGRFQGLLRGAPDCERLLPRAAALLNEVVDAAASRLDESQDAEEEPSKNNEAYVDEGAAEEAAGAVVTWARFAPVMRFVEGLTTVLEAVAALEDGLAPVIPGSHGELPPAVARATLHASSVAEAMSTLQPVFQSGRLKAKNEGLVLEPGLNAECDAAAARLEASERVLEAAVDHARNALLAMANGTLPKGAKIKLVRSGINALLEAPVALKSYAPDGFVAVKETKTLVRFQVPAVITAAELVTDAIAESQEATLRYLQQSAAFFLDRYPLLLEFCSAVATLDALAAFADATHPEAAPPGCSFCRPSFAANVTPNGPPPPLRLQGVWNPQLLLAEAPHKEACHAPDTGAQCSRSSTRFQRVSIQPNDLDLGSSDAPSATLILTGANTGGKSTLLRAACLAVVMAQVGCFVPCTSAELAPVDRIFTRMGAYDRLAAGQSTFCVEMTETAAVLRHAHRSSLVVLDELGRGTSTHDGSAIAAAVAHWLTVKTQCRLLFATHHHGLTKDAALLEAGVRLGHMRSWVDHNGLVPSYKLLPGAAPDGSCGTKVAATAGIPQRLVAHAEKAACALEKVGTRAGAFPVAVAANGQDEGDCSMLEVLRKQLLDVLRAVTSTGIADATSARRLGEAQAAVRRALMVEC